MKTDIISKVSRFSRAVLATTIALASAASVHADNFFDNTVAGVNLGNASGGYTGGHSNWAIFSLSGNVTITDPVNYTPGVVSTYDVIGNVGIAGSGNLNMTDSYIDGYVSESTGTSMLAGHPADPYFKGISYGGSNTSYNQQARDDAFAASAAATFAGTGGGQNGAILGSATTAVYTSAKTEANLGITGSLAGNTYVVNLTDLVLQGSSAILTLHGTSTTNYIFNVSRYMSLAGGAKINIDGSLGLTDANVLYNVQSNPTQYDVTLSGASEVHGIILATTRAVKETGGSKVYGEVIAKSVSLSGSSKVINPFASP